MIDSKSDLSRRTPHVSSSGHVAIGVNNNELANGAAPRNTNEVATCSPLYSLDLELTKMLGICVKNDSELGSIRPLMKGIELSGTGYVWIAGGLIVAAMAHRIGTQHFVVNFFAAILLDLVIVGSLKALFRRPRPNFMVHDMFGTYAVDHYSFPSGHATRAVLLACLFCNKFLVAFPAKASICLWSFLVCFSRLSLGRHHVSDVLFGALIGYIEYLIMDSYWMSQETSLLFLRPYHENFFY